MEDPAKKQCPQCGETILAVAKKCRFCQSEIAQQNASTAPHDETLALIALVMPVIGIALSWFWIGGMWAIENPQGAFSAVIGVVIIGTSLLIAIDAQRLGFGDRKGEDGPIGWFIGCLFCWAIGFPLYYFRRRRRGAKSMRAAAVAVSMAFLLFVLGFKLLLVIAS